MRIIGTLVILLGLAVLVLGIILMTQSNTARNEVADSIAPLPLDQLDDRYDAVTDQYNQMKAAGAQPDAQFNYLYATKTGLGLARANVGKARMLNINGIVDIIAGAGLVLAGLGLLRKAQA